jgi:hypothetical protein
VCSRESRSSPWLWWESSSVWTNGRLVVPLFVDLEAGEFGGPLVLVRQGRHLFRDDDLCQALRAVLEYVALGTGEVALRESELAELRRLEGEYRRRPGTTGATRLSLLKELQTLILESKNAAREALDRGRGDQVTPRLIDVEALIRTVVEQLGDTQLSTKLFNYLAQVQNAYSTISRWQEANEVVKKMIVEATH